MLEDDVTFIKELSKFCKKRDAWNCAMEDKKMARG
jgi:hypothetical protein